MEASDEKSLRGGIVVYRLSSFRRACAARAPFEFPILRCAQVGKAFFFVGLGAGIAACFCKTNFPSDSFSVRLCLFALCPVLYIIVVARRLCNVEILR